jgi:hypothetical protein
MGKYAAAMWAMYDWTFYYEQTKANRKKVIRRMIACGLSARQAIQELRDYEYGAEHGPSH